MSTSQPAPAPSPRPTHASGGVLPYASPGAHRGGSWTGYHAVAVAAVVAAAVGILVVWWVHYRTAAVSIQSRFGAQRAIVQSLRSQVALFKLQHNDRLPGVCPLVESGGPFGANERTFWAQLTQYTDRDGYTSHTKTGRFCNGPYMQSVPANWFNGSKTVASAPAPGVGFVYDFAGGAGSGKVWGVDELGALVQQ